MLNRALSKAIRKGNAPLAQLVEQLTLNQWVRGSSPRRCTTNTKYSILTQNPVGRKVLQVSVTNAEGPPVPIPNTEVKLCSAENTCLETDREDRSTLTQKVGYSNAEGPPVPIPNTEVKLCSAENTCLETDREDRS